MADEDVFTFDDMESTPATAALVRGAEQPPTVLPTIVLDDVVPFPGAVVPLILDQPARRDAIQYAKQHGGMVLLINRRPGPERHPHEALTEAQAKVVEHLVRAQAQDGNSSEEASGEGPSVEPLFIGKPVRVNGTEDDPPVEVVQLHEVGVVARLMRVVRMPDDRLSALLQVFRRAQPKKITERDPTLLMQVEYPAETSQTTTAFQALVRQVRINLQAFFEAHPSVSDELKVAAIGIEAPGVVADFVGQHLSRDTAERLAFLAELNLGVRMRRALEITIRELDLLTVGNRISQEIRDKVEKHQRDFLLREQLKSIRAELGEEKDPAVMAMEDLGERLKQAKLPKQIQDRVDEEMRRLGMLPSESPEHNTIRSYLEWIACLPWSHGSVERHDIKRARMILDEDHFGLDEVKDRIIEFLAVHQLNPGKVGTLMCFSGPPGVGKTSLGQSIARALGRDFYRFSVGGMRDEAEIKGHRRTYIGAMPGRIIQGLKQTRVNNPVFMLDELDKIGSDWRGDPSSALLEVLDPAQNKTFADHYLDLPFDLSKVMFIATVNVHTELPGPLRDRLEIIDLPGYIHEEKLQIAQRYLLPRQRTEHGLKRNQLSLGRPALARMISSYTHEAGVRELERMVAKVCRKRALAVVTKKKYAPAVTQEAIVKYLGPPKIVDDRVSRSHKPGVALGLAWTAVGGEVLFIEAAAMPGKGLMKITGQLGEVMDESAKLALSYVQVRGASLGIDPKWLETHDIHLHFPAGAVKKDGPSAGVTVTSALVSLLTGRPLAPSLAMTGEITLRGEVLPVGGIREKVVAARRAGVRTVLVPERNRADVWEIPDAVRDKLQFVFAKDFDDVMAAVFNSKSLNVIASKASNQTKLSPARRRPSRRKQAGALAGKKK